MKYHLVNHPRGNTEKLNDKLYMFQLEKEDRDNYSKRLYGFSHGTKDANSFRAILQSDKLECSYNIRQRQAQANIHQTGGDRGHFGQYTVYFRYVERKNRRNIPQAIVRSLGGVGGSSGYVFFTSLNKIFEQGICFSLASGYDGIGGTSSLTQKRADNFEKRYLSKKIQNKKTLEAVKQIRKLTKSEEESLQAYQNKYDISAFGKHEFEAGLKAAEANSRGNEIGFCGNIPLSCIEIIMISDTSFNDAYLKTKYNYIGLYPEEIGPWRVYVKKGSTLNDILDSEKYAPYPIKTNWPEYYNAKPHKPRKKKRVKSFEYPPEKTKEPFNFITEATPKQPPDKVHSKIYKKKIYDLSGYYKNHPFPNNREEKPTQKSNLPPLDKPIKYEQNNANNIYGYYKNHPFPTNQHTSKKPVPPYNHHEHNLNDKINQGSPTINIVNLGLTPKIVQPKLDKKNTWHKKK